MEIYITVRLKEQYDYILSKNQRHNEIVSVQSKNDLRRVALSIKTAIFNMEPGRDLIACYKKKLNNRNHNLQRTIVTGKSEFQYKNGANLNQKMNLC